MWRNISAHDRAGFDHGAFADPHVGKNHTMRTDEDVPFDHDRTLVLNAARTPVEMSEDRCPQPDRAVISDKDAIGMAIIHVDEVREPDMLADLDTAQAVKPGPEAGSARTDECHNVKKTT